MKKEEFLNKIKTDIGSNSLKTGFTISGERVVITDEKRNLGHGEQVKVIYSDNSIGWEHVQDIQNI